ncbi:MAG TPA: hypothetical protein VIV11_23380, partial [Kofleriaceae bacterium]
MNGRPACLALAFALVLSACSEEEGPTALGGSLTVTGTVHDFQTGAQVQAGAATVSTAGLLSARVTIQGASFTIEGVPENSAFQVLASVPGTHRPTYSQMIEVISDDLDGLVVKTVSEDFLASLATGFGVTPTSANGVLFLRLVDGA